MKKSLIWTIVTLVGLYVCCQIIADVAATKFIEVAGVVMPAGTFIFAITFTLRDMIHKRLGKEWARAAIVTAAGFNILLSAYLFGMSKLNAPAWFGLAESWNSIFYIVPSIVIGSIVAEVISELIDTEVYHLWKSKLPKAPQWSRVLISNLISIPVDSLIFSTMAFVLLPPLFGAKPIPLWEAILGVSVGQIIYKSIITLVSMPGIYFVKDKPIIPDIQE